jgi:hypothetical protein
LGLLTDQGSGIATGLDGGLPDGDEGGLEFARGVGADGDETDVADDAVTAGEVGSCLNTSPYSAVVAAFLM